MENDWVVMRQALRQSIEEEEWKEMHDKLKELTKKDRRNEWLGRRLLASETFISVYNARALVTVGELAQFKEVHKMVLYQQRRVQRRGTD